MREERSEKRWKVGSEGEDYIADVKQAGEGGEDCLLLLDLPGLGQAGERYSSSPLSSSSSVRGLSPCCPIV